VNVKAKVLNTWLDENGNILSKIQVNGKMLKKGELITVHFGGTRSLSQNALYFKYLTFLIEDCGLKDQGHFSVEALHENLKEKLLSDKIFDRGKFKSIETATTTTLDKVAFAEYLEHVDHFVQEFFNVNTVPFWELYKKDYQLWP